MMTGLVVAATPLMEARKDFSTKTDGARDAKVLTPVRGGKAIKFQSGALQLSATVMTPKNKAAKLPAIVWLTGGFPCCGVDEETWAESPDANDQSARQYFDAGMVMLFPTLRGANGNPGTLDSYWGEVDDVLAAIEWLKHQPNIDPNRIWLGGHSAGATMAVLAAEAGAPVQGVIAFGGAAEVCDYGAQRLHFDVHDTKECELRSPLKWLSTTATPMWFIAGAFDDSYGHWKLRAAAGAASNRHFFSITGATHFDALLPVNTLIAKRLAAGLPPLADDDEAQRAFDAVPQETVAMPDGGSFRVPPDFEKAEAPDKSSLVYDRDQVRIFVQFPGRGLLNPAKPCFAPNDHATTIHAKWNGFELCGARVMADKKELLMFVQVPLAPNFIVVGVRWRFANDQLLEPLLQRVLNGVKGPTNWK